MKVRIVREGDFGAGSTFAEYGIEVGKVYPVDSVGHRDTPTDHEYGTSGTWYDINSEDGEPIGAVHESEVEVIDE